MSSGIRRFNEHMLTEHYENLFLSNVEERLKYADRVWDMLNKAYESIGGLKGSGLSSKEEMIATIPLWKLKRRGDEILAVSLYKINAGRKRVAVATNVTPEGKDALRDMFRQDFEQKRSWVEVSGPSLRFLEKTFGEQLSEFEMTPEQVQQLIPDTKITPTGNGNRYTREIGGNQMEKLALGNPNVELEIG